MTVHELQALLSRADPDDTLMIDGSSGSLIVTSTRPGMHQVIELTTPTKEEEKFLRAMHIKW